MFVLLYKKYVQSLIPTPPPVTICHDCPNPLPLRSYVLNGRPHKTKKTCEKIAPNASLAWMLEERIEIKNEISEMGLSTDFITALCSHGVYYFHWHNLGMSVWGKFISKTVGCRNVFHFLNYSPNKRYIWNLYANRIQPWYSTFGYSLGTCNIVKPGNVSPELSVPDHIVKPDYYYEYTPPGCPDSTSTPEIKTSEDIQQMRETCKLAANILKSCENIIKVRHYLD